MHLPATSLLLLGFLTLPALPAMIALSATDSGFFNEAGRSSKNDGILLGAPPATFNYSTGTIAEVPPLSGTDVPRRNYFTFDLSGIAPGTISSAALSIYLPADGFSSPDASELYTLLGIPAPDSEAMAGFADSLLAIYDIGLAPTLTAAMSIYDTLGGFPGLGEVSVSESDEDSMLTIPLTPAGVDYLNLFAGDLTVIAGEVASLDLTDGVDEVVFGETAPLISGVVSPDPLIPVVTPTPVLMLETVPEPSLAMLVLLGTFPLLGRRSIPSRPRWNVARRGEKTGPVL